MINQPIVSVIIAAYNAEEYVATAITSAQVQTLENIEILVVDDASQDATRAIVETRAALDPRLHLVALPTNGGPGKARNAGLARARGKWVAVLDADDTFAPHRLEKLVALAATTGVEMVADNLLLLYPGRSETLLSAADGAATFTIDAPSFVAANRGRRNQGRQLYGFLKPVIRRSFLTQHTIAYHEIRLAEDYFLALECLIHGARWIVLAEPMYHYAVRDDSLSGTFTPDQLDAIARVDRLLLGAAIGSRDELWTAIEDHLAAVTRAAVWTRFVDAVRGRDFRRAAALTLTDAGAARSILRESIAAGPRVFLRLARSQAWIGRRRS